MEDDETKGVRLVVRLINEIEVQVRYYGSERLKGLSPGFRYAGLSSS